MKIVTEFSLGRLTVSLHGELDHHAAKGLIEGICKEIDKSLPGVCVLDMRGVTFMDSSGIAVILKTYKRMKELGGEVKVTNINKQTGRVLDMSGLNKIISMEEIKA